MRGTIYTIFALFALLMASCTPNNGGEEQSTTTQGTYTINGVEHTFKSILSTMVGDYGDYIAFIATPEEGYTSFTQLYNSSVEYLYGTILPTLNGYEFNLMSEVGSYTFRSTLNGARIEGVAPGQTDELQSGKACISYNNGRLTATGSLVLHDGTTLTFNIAMPANMTINSNYVVCDNQRKPLRTAFYYDEEGEPYIGLYFTPAGLDYFEDLDTALSYMYIMASRTTFDGVRHDIVTLDDEHFSFGYVTNSIGSSNIISIASGDLAGATGSISLQRTNEDTFKAEIELMINGMSYICVFDGKAIPHTLAPEVKSNYLIHKGTEKSLTAATATKGEQCMTITITADDNSQIVATIPESMCDGNMYGFSRNDILGVSYDGTLYSKATGYSGTLAVLIDYEALTMQSTFTNYKDFEYSYSGKITISE